MIRLLVLGFMGIIAVGVFFLMLGILIKLALFALIVFAGVMVFRALSRQRGVRREISRYLNNP